MRAADKQRVAYRRFMPRTVQPCVELPLYLLCPLCLASASALFVAADADAAAAVQGYDYAAAAVGLLPDNIYNAAMLCDCSALATAAFAIAARIWAAEVAARA